MGVGGGERFEAVRQGEKREGGWGEREEKGRAAGGGGGGGLGGPTKRGGGDGRLGKTAAA